jgi:long-chain-fatty-acid--CoA ligase ACSBG
MKNARSAYFRTRRKIQFYDLLKIYIFSLFFYFLFKGVMLTHDNLLFVAKTGCDFEKFKNAQEVLISYLPLSHIAAQIVDIYACLTSAGTVYFADKDALKGSLAKTIRQVRPTRFLGVPRVYEKMHEKMLEIGSTQNFLMRAVGSWAKGVTLQHHLDRMSGKETNTLQYQLAKKFIISKVKTAMGFDRCQTFSSGAAPISIETKKYFMSLDMPIIEIFGMSESSGGHSFSTTDAPNFDTVGKGLPNVLTKIHQPDENGDGEILVKGRHVMMGYLNDVDKTFETIDDDGWLSTGDVGRIDNDGNLYITGRLKEIIITAGGENVPPVHVENLVKKEIPAISNAFLVGDKKKYLTILISLKTQMQADTGAPLDDLSAESIKWIESLNLKYKKLSQILDGPDPDVLKAIEEGIQRANRNAISNAQKIQKFKILPHDFSIPTGEIGPTLKVKRNVVSEKYKDLIESMYQ